MDAIRQGLVHRQQPGDSDTRLEDALRVQWYLQYKKFVCSAGM